MQLRRNETETTQLKVRLGEAEREAADLRARLGRAEEAAAERARLVQRLEEDLAAHVKTTGGAPPAGPAGAEASDGVEGILGGRAAGAQAQDGTSVVQVVCAQRDRFKARSQELEAVRRSPPAPCRSHRAQPALCRS